MQANTGRRTAAWNEPRLIMPPFGVHGTTTSLAVHRHPNNSLWPHSQHQSLCIYHSLSNLQPLTYNTSFDFVMQFHRARPPNILVRDIIYDFWQTSCLAHVREMDETLFIFTSSYSDQRVPRTPSTWHLYFSAFMPDVMLCCVFLRALGTHCEAIEN